MELLEALRAERGSDALIAYVTSTRPGLTVQMAQDAVRLFGDHLPGSKVAKLDLFIHSNGGDSIVPWRLMTLLREYAEQVDVLVPHHAFSAATLAGLGANGIVMHPMGMLGPIDPTVQDPFSPVDPQSGQPRAVSVEDVSAYIALVKDDVGIRHEDELVQAFAQLAEKIHPLTLGHAKRGTAQARMLGEKLLRLRDPTIEQHTVDQLLEELTTKLYYHGHPINRREAKEDLDLHVEEPSKKVEKGMWDLYLLYEEELQMKTVFDPIAAAVAAGATITPGAWTSVVLPTLRLAAVESQAMGHILEQDLHVSIAQGGDGGIAANAAAIRTEWVEES